MNYFRWKCFEVDDADVNADTQRRKRILLFLRIINCIKRLSTRRCEFSEKENFVMSKAKPKLS